MRPHGVLVVVVRRGDGVRPRRHAIKLEVGRVRLGDDVHGARRMLMFVFVFVFERRRRLAADGGGGGLGGQLGVLEGGEGGVERAAERLREGAGVLGGCCAECGHGVWCVGFVWCGYWAGKRGWGWALFK